MPRVFQTFSLAIILVLPSLALGQLIAVKPDSVAVLGGHHQYLTAVALSPDGRTLAHADSSGSIQMWDVGSRKELRQFKEPDGWASAIAFSPDGKRLATGGTKSFCVRTLETGKEIWTSKAVSGELWSVAWSSDGKLVAASGMPTRITIRSAKTGAETISLDPKCDGTTSLVFSHSGKFLAAGTVDSSVLIWETEHWKIVKLLRGHTKTVTGLAITGDDKRLVSGSKDLTVKVWSLETAKELSSINIGQRTKDAPFPSRALAVSGNGHLLAKAFSDGVVEFWDLDKRRGPLRLQAHTEFIPSMVMTPDGQMLITVAQDGTAKLWNVSKLLPEEWHK